MKLIIWLWNPGDKYRLTRHNLGFLFLDYLKEKDSFEDFKVESKFKWEISNGIFNWEKTILLKPQTFMNLSWESIKKISDFYKIEKTDLIVIFDDISLDFTKVRFRDKWSAGWHNGLKDIIKYFWEEFKRIKTWIWFNDNFDVSNFVLSKFSDKELDELNDNVFPKIYSILKEQV